MTNEKKKESFAEMHARMNPFATKQVMASELIEENINVINALPQPVKNTVDQAYLQAITDAIIQYHKDNLVKLSKMTVNDPGLKRVTDLCSKITAVIKEAAKSDTQAEVDAKFTALQTFVNEIVSGKDYKPGHSVLKHFKPGTGLDSILKKKLKNVEGADNFIDADWDIPKPTRK